MLILGFFSISQLAKNMLKFFQTVTKTVLFCLFFNRKHIHCNKSLDEQLGSKYQFYLPRRDGRAGEGRQQGRGEAGRVSRAGGQSPPPSAAQLLED